MASVTFRNGLTVDDSAGPAGLAGGGHRIRFVPSLSATVDTALESKNWASLLGSLVFDGEYSAKEYAVGDLTVTGGSSKAWAIDSDSVTVDGVDYSARAHAIGTVIPSGSAKDWAAGTRNIGGLLSARIYADNASASALSALNAPGTTATSTSSQTLPVVGSTYPFTLTYTIQTGKTLVVGAFVIAASTASPSNYAIGQVTAYNSGTGVLTISVAAFAQVGGSGTFSSWTISLTALANVAGAATLAGNNTLSGQNTFNNATAPIITAKIGPTSAQQHTLPTVTSDTITLLAATQTLTNKTLTAPVVSGGSINNTPIGATTPSTVSATTIAASGTSTLQAVSATTLSTSGTATLASATVSGSATLGSLTVTGTAALNGNTTIGDAGTDTATLSAQLSANASVGTVGQMLTSRAANLSPQWEAPIKAATVATLSGTSQTFSIPAGVRRIQFLPIAMSTSGSSRLQLRLATAGGTVSTGYDAAGQTGGGAAAALTTGFPFLNDTAAGDSQTGVATLVRQTGNTWIWNYLGKNGTAQSTASGSIALAAELTSIVLTTTNGTDTFDAGTANVVYEY